jgi:hypothetical protein
LVKKIGFEGDNIEELFVFIKRLAKEFTYYAR